MAVDRDLRAETVESWGSAVSEEDAHTMRVVALIKSISETMDRASDWACSGLNVSASELEVLVPLRHGVDGMTAARLAERLNMSRAGVSKHLSRLESRGLLGRAPSVGDARSSVVTLTEDGCVAVDEAFARELKVHGQVLGECSSAEWILEALRTLDGTVGEGLTSLGEDLAD